MSRPSWILCRYLLTYISIFHSVKRECMGCQDCQFCHWNQQTINFLRQLVNIWRPHVWWYYSILQSCHPQHTYWTLGIFHGPFAINLAAIGAGTRPEESKSWEKKGCCQPLQGTDPHWKRSCHPTWKESELRFIQFRDGSGNILSCLVRSCYVWGILQLKEIRANECFFDQGWSLTMSGCVFFWHCLSLRMFFC